MRENLYRKSFNLFLKNTDEKRVVLEFIKKNVKLNKKINFLDIGGGNGFLAFNISKKVKKTFIVEPNRFFFKKFRKNKKNKAIKARWEDVELNNKFDFILVAYVVTYFPAEKRKNLIRKMYNYLNSGGKIIILSVDVKKGSWRKIHNYFYDLMGIKHKSSDEELKKIMKDYKAKTKTFSTHVVSKNKSEMLNILGFDFFRYPEELLKYRKNLELFLSRHEDNKGNIILEVIHNAYIITKK